MSDRVRPLIEAHLSLHDIFGITNRQVQRIVKTAANAAGITRPVSPHVLRHTFSVTALQIGISRAAIQKILDHDHLSTTQIYLNLSPVELLRFRGRLGTWASGG